MRELTRGSRRAVTATALIGCCVLAMACQKSAPDRPERTVRDSSGVQVVEYSDAAQARWNVDGPLWESHRIPSAEAVALHGITAVLGVDSGTALVAESQPARLVLLDFRRGRIHQLGGSGGGPGEFLAITWMGRQHVGDGFLIFDGRQKRLSPIGQDLSLRESIVPARVASGTGAIPDIRGQLADGRYVASSALLARRSAGSSLVRQPLRLQLLEPDGTAGDSITTVLGDEALDVAGVVMRPGFLKRSSIVVAPDAIHVADASAYEVRSYTSEGRLARIVRLPARNLVVPDSALVRVRELDASILPNTVHLPEVSGLLLDDSGRLWLGRHALPDSPTEWTVIDTAGMPSATVAVPPGFRLMSVWNGLLFGVGRGPLGEETVQVLGHEWK